MGFVYHNENPYGLREEDCVTRAIAFASDRDYEDIQEKLYHTSKLLDCDKLCVCCYYHLIDNVFQFQRLKLKGVSVEYFAEKHPKGTYLIRVPGHITVVKDGDIYDTWDCGKKIATHIWKIE